MGYILLKSLIATCVILLLVEFWLGMNLNLFVSLPNPLPSNFSYNGGAELLAHVGVGITIFVLASLILSYGSRLRNLLFTSLSAMGFVFAIVAPATGATFSLRGQDDVLSLAMAMSFIIIFAVFLSEFFLIDKVKNAGFSFR